MPNPVFFRKKPVIFLCIMLISFLFMNNYVNYVNFCSRKPFFLKTLIILNSNYFTLFC